MGTTVIGPTAAEFPATVYATVVQIKEHWSDDWLWVPELQLRSAAVRTAGGGMDSAVFVRRYGLVKLPWESDFATHTPTGSIAGWWVRILFAAPGGLQPVWIGRFSADTRDPWGDDAGSASGQESYTAHGPMQILHKIHVSTSFWDVDGVDDPQELGWVPSINDRDERGWIVGNRSADPCGEEEGDEYLYGGQETWTHRQYADYLLARFVDESDDGPRWALGGQFEVLDRLSEPIKMQDTQTAAEILGHLISKRLGLDYCVFADDDGFIVWVYSLTAAEYTFGDETLPANPNTVQIVAGQTADSVRTTIETSEDHGYQKLRVLGERILVCCSLRGAEVSDPGGVVPDDQLDTLHEKWDENLEVEYLAGTGNVDSEPGAHDTIREQEKFAAVFRHYGAPVDWDWHGGQAAPVLDAAGELVSDGDERAGYQNTVRRTENWTPLREGCDYSTDPPTDGNPTGVEPEFRPPAVWIGKQDAANLLGWAAEDYYTPIDQVGFGVQTLQTDWGVKLSGKKAHLLADGHWDGAASTNFVPCWDYDHLVATVAMRTDQRLMLVYEMPDATPAGGVKDLIVKDAEYWYLAPHTVVGVDDEGHLITSGDSGRELRNDRDRLLFVMAGALSRYFAGRRRASIEINGLAPWSLLVGQILTVVETGGPAQQMAAPITSVEWTVPEGSASPTTRISAGYAG